MNVIAVAFTVVLLQPLYGKAIEHIFVRTSWTFLPCFITFAVPFFSFLLVVYAHV